MHTLHGSAASVSAASTTSGANGGLPRKHRYSSRSNSLSSASVVTARRSASRSSSSTGVRSSAGLARAQSPADPSSVALRLGRDSMAQQEHRRRQSVAVDPSERVNGEGLSTFQRWSHSTNSSVTSATLARNRASSGAALPNMPIQTFSPHKKTRSVVDHSPRPSPQKRTSSRPSSRRRGSPSASPERERRLPLTALPPLHTTPALTDPNDTESPSTIPVATPSTQSSYGQDYFGEDGVSPRSNGRVKKNIVIRNHTAAMVNGGAMQSQAVEGAEQDSRDLNADDDLPPPTPKSKYFEPTSEHELDRPPTTGESSRHKRTGTRERIEKEKKAMLSKALQKANTAVLLDNAQNFEGALEAYSDACRLLQQVMDRTSGVEDKRKLDSIRVTYTNRVEELRQLEAAQPEASSEKSLPTRPMSDESLPISPDSGSVRSPAIDAHFDRPSSPVKESVTATHVDDEPKVSEAGEDRDSFLSETMRAVDQSTQPTVEEPLQPMIQEPVPEPQSLHGPVEDQHHAAARTLAPAVPEEVLFMKGQDVGLPPPNVDGLHIPPSNNKYIPAPLSPRRPSLPDINPDGQAEDIPPVPQMQEPVEKTVADDSYAAGSSWLDPIDESDSDCASSVHSVSSQQGLRRKHIRGASGDTNPDFDAAFDSALEAAYNEGFEPDLEGMRKVEPASTRHALKESVTVPSSEIKEILSPTSSYHPGVNTTMDLGLDDDEEERILDDITQDYAQAFNFDLASKSALPRQSDSSGYSRSTWQSSQTSDRTTAGTSLSTVAEDGTAGTGSKNAFANSASLNSVLAEPPPPPSAPPPLGSLPKIPTAAQERSAGVRSRRLSGQNLKQLKIETAPQLEPRQRASTFHQNASPFKEEGEESLEEESKKDSSFGSELQATTSMSSEQRHEHLLASPPSLDMLSVVADTSRPNTATTITSDQRRSIDDNMPGELLSPRPTLIRKNNSGLSLRENTHTVILPSPMEPPAALTPMSSTYMTFASKQQNGAPISSQRAQLPAYGVPYSDATMPGGIYLFDTSLTNPPLPTSPRSPGGFASPVALEPCPEPFLLRPFWLMRAIHSTLAHPKGGYLTTRLFVPREVWQTKGVKLKAVEDKVANCDLLTAALGRLAGVDTYDADALMEELQNFEEVMERVQTSFVKKLGSDVGIGGMAALFKDAAATVPGSASTAAGAPPAAAEPPPSSGAEKTKSKEHKGYLTSWRKLRSKSSGTPSSTSSSQPGSHQSKILGNKALEKDLPTLPSVPMTSFVPVERRGGGLKKDSRMLVFEGPQREYMGSLARLFEGAQVLGTFTFPVLPSPQHHKLHSLMSWCLSRY